MRIPAGPTSRASAILCLLAALPTSLLADTIYLKNGRKIAADHVIQQDGQVSYDTPAGRMSFPLSIVDRVVHDEAPGEHAPGTPSDRAANLHIAPPVVLSAPASDTEADAAVHDGAIDSGLLSALESEASANPTPAEIARLVAAESAAARFEISVGDYEKAVGYYNTALQFAPENAPLLVETAYLHLRRSEYSAAADLLDRARRAEPDSPDVAKLAGWAYYGLNRLPDAVSEWKHALALRPDPEVQHALEKAERDAQEEEGYHEGETTHFQLRYNGDATPDLASQILRTLESQYNEIASALNYEPPEQIAVILYTNQTFMDITRAPSWSGALNDGRMRIPVEGLSSVTDELARVLKHELTHSFVSQKTAGRCPVWLQEGIAQYMEGKRSRSMAATLTTQFNQHMEISLASYEGSWLNLPKEDATRAYIWSLAVVEAIVTVDGVDDLDRVLDRIGEGDTTEDAIHAVLHENYDDLMLSTAQYLRQAYL